MCIKARVSQSALEATLIMAFFFLATHAGAADWTVDSMGYTLHCDIVEIEKTYFAQWKTFGQWKTFKAIFSIPADAGAKLSYFCEDGGGKSATGDPAYDFHCEVKVDQPGGSFYISHTGNHSYIKDLVPGLITANYACKKIADASKAEVKKK